MHDTFSSTNQVFYSVSWDLVIWNGKMLDTRHFLIHHEILFLTTHKFWGWTKEIDILHLWNNRNENSSIFSLCFYISCFSYLHSLSFFPNTLIWNANMQNKSHTSFPMNSIKRSIACWQKKAGQKNKFILWMDNLHTQKYLHTNIFCWKNKFMSNCHNNREYNK